MLKLINFEIDKISFYKKQIFILSLVLSFVVLTIFRNIMVFEQGCFPCNDFALFIEALNKIASGDLNPFLDSRQIHYFNDHWEPIFFIPSMIYHFVSSFVNAGQFLLVFDVLIFLSGAFFFVSRDQK